MNTQTATAPHKGKPRIEREAKLTWVPLSLMRVSPEAQRDLNQSRVNHIAANMDLEKLGYPYVSHRDGLYWIMDGQHRVEALKQWDDGWEQQRLECWSYEGLSEKEEADKFLDLNDQLAVSTFDKFKVGLNAGRQEETAIAAIVSHLGTLEGLEGMNISKQRSQLSISAVGTLRKVYRMGGPKGLRRTLFILGHAYGQAGLEAYVMQGMGLVVHRYGDMLEDQQIISALTAAAGGVNGLLNQAEVLRKTTGSHKAHCVAAAAVDIIRRRRGGTRIKKWWHTENGEATAS